MILGLVYRTSGRKYAPGPGIHVLAAQTIHASGLIRDAVPFLQKLHDYGFVVAKLIEQKLKKPHLINGWGF